MIHEEQTIKPSNPSEYISQNRVMQTRSQVRTNNLSRINHERQSEIRINQSIHLNQNLVEPSNQQLPTQKSSEYSRK